MTRRRTSPARPFWSAAVVVVLAAGVAAWITTRPGLAGTSVLAVWGAWAVLALLCTRWAFRPRRRPTARTVPSTTDELAAREIERPGRGGLRITYRPRRNGAPDGGEIVWAWVPYADDPSQGKDRPLLVIGEQDGRHVFALKLTSRSREGYRDHVGIGSGPWDARGRPSWIDIDQLYSVHRYGIRREAAALDHDRFLHVAAALQKRHGWILEP
ncbi:type II toxin-antitoxin system PemK/MazF family toxin [Microbacterium sp.]|uniref:type II toxin-antitoxin system PemK/MazF family toxin n=1 Tax=Microbacterium sp. TaxID=51671 RepID=UPI0039E2DD31